MLKLLPLRSESSNIFLLFKVAEEASSLTLSEHTDWETHQD